MPDILTTEEINMLLEVIDPVNCVNESISDAENLIKEHSFIRVPIVLFEVMTRQLQDYRTLLQETESNES